MEDEVRKRPGASGDSPRATITMPKRAKEREADEEEPRRISQVKPELKRFRVYVDRQLKSSFDKAEDADKMAAGIKKGFPVVTVSVYDAQKSVSKDID